MKQLVGIILITFSLATLPVLAQDTVRTVYRVSTRAPFTLDENTIIYNKATGERMPYQELLQIIRSNPKISLTRQIGERGEVVSLLYDPNTTALKTQRDISQRAKRGDPFPEFIVTTVQQHVIESARLNGRVVVLAFYLDLREPIVTPKMISEFEEVMRRKAPESVAVIFTTSQADEIKAVQSKTPITLPLVEDAINFHERYLITTFPSFVVRNQEGRMAGYANSLSELEALLNSVR